MKFHVTSHYEARDGRLANSDMPRCEDENMSYQTPPASIDEAA